MNKLGSRYSRQHTNKGSSIAEMGPVLLVLFVVVLFPLVGLFSFIDGVAILALAANVGARNAAPTTTRTQAIAQVAQVRDQLLTGGFASFGGITPNDRGLTLSVLEIQGNGAGTTKSFSGTTPVSPAPDVTKNVYLYQVTAKYDIKPMFCPTTFSNMTFSATSAIEHIRGINN